MSKKFPIKSWNTSREYRPPPRPSNGTPNQIIVADLIFMNNFTRDLSWKKEIPIDFGNYPERAVFHQYPTVPLLTTSNN